MKPIDKHPRMQSPNDIVLVAERLSKTVQAPGADSNHQLTILHEISLTVRAGESIAILGASGSGKSTLLSLLAGLDVPSGGSVEAFGERISEMDEDARAQWRARYIGFVFQSFHLLPALSALENVMLPLELAGAASARGRAEHMLQRVGMGERLRHYPRTLSGGEQQRVALARAFVTTPRLLFADEPTGSLDTATGAEVIQLMAELNREHGTTLVLVTHDEQTALHCARRVRLAAGRVLSDETLPA
jgi:putative ABC transport system ATP-binding protein